MTDSSVDLPVVLAAEVESPDDVTDRRIDGVVLAGGTSSRFGAANKLLIQVDREPMVRRAARTLLESRVDRTIVVVGYEADRVRGVIEDLDVTVLENESYEVGKSTSVRVAVEALDGDAAVFALGDMPYIDPGTVDALVAAYEAGVGTALAAAYRGQRGNPVLFDRQHFGRLADLLGDAGGRGVLLEASNRALVEVDDPGVLADVDTPEVLDRLPDNDEKA